MKLHANARTCPHSRRLAVDRVEREGWTLAAAAEAAGVSVRTVSKWLRRYRDEGEQGLLDRCSAPACGAVADRRGACRGDCRAASVADDGRGDRRDAGDAGLDGLGDLDPDRAGQALAAGAARAAEPLREEAAGRARPRRRQEAWPDRPAGPPRQRRPPHAKPRDRLGVRPCRDRRRDPARLRRGARRREGHHRGRLPRAARSRTSPPSGSASSG